MKKLMLGAVGSLFILSACSEGPMAPAPVEAPEAPAEFGEPSGEEFTGTFGLVESGAVANGGFESGLDDWNPSGAVYAQTGTTEPGGAFPVPSPPEGNQAAMTDAFGFGVHTWYQDVVVPADATLHFQLFIGNWASFFTDEGPLDPGVFPNIQFRADIMDPAADVNNVDAGVRENVYLADAGHPPFTGVTEDSPEASYIPIEFDLGNFAGETVRIRFAQVSNAGPFSVGIDNVVILVPGEGPDGPTARDDCMNGGWEAFGFKNQGQCVRFVETGKDSR